MGKLKGKRKRPKGGQRGWSSSTTLKQEATQALAERQKGMRFGPEWGVKMSLKTAQAHLWQNHQGGSLCC